MKPTFIALFSVCLFLPVTAADKITVPLWEFKTGGPVTSSPAIGSDGTVYIGSWDKKLYALNGKSGVKLWEFETGFYVETLPAIGSDGTVYVGSMDKKLYAINGKSGVKLWEFETGGLVDSSPAIGSDGTVYVGSHDKKLYALNLKHGREMAAKLKKLPDGKKLFTTVKGIYLGMNIYRAAEVLNSKDSKLERPQPKVPGWLT
jgi:outer membrane protein assembly factor BamB